MKIDKDKWSKIQEVKNNIWKPETPDDYLELEPKLILTRNDPDWTERWQILKTFISTMPNNSILGRMLRFVVIDDITEKYLGVICISSDFMDIAPRDNYIGWNKGIKNYQKMINHIANCQTIVPTQPLGYNYTGGKLLSLLAVSRPIEDAWKVYYGDTLVGLTTTSLYGSFSQYNGLKYWKKMGRSAGSTKFEVSAELFKRMKHWLKYHYPRKYYEFYVAKRESGFPLHRDHKQRSLNYIYNKLKIPKKQCTTSFQRGVYFCELFKNTCEYLRKEIDESKLERKFDNSYEVVAPFVEPIPFELRVYTYEDWLADQPPFKYFDTEQIKKAIIKELKFLNKMDSREYLLYRKHLEIDNFTMENNYEEYG